MLSSELNVDDIDGVEIQTPLEDRCLSPLNTPPVDFTLLTTSQLGISTQSFTPSSGRKEKSRLAQLKLKRRSNVGVRGSPETNSLIRYIAQQRMRKASPAACESVSARPFTPRVSKLKQDMAVFQSLLCEEEPFEKVPRKESPIAECIKTRTDPCDGRSRDAWKENCPPPVTPQLGKRWWPGPLCEGEIREASAAILQHSPLKTREDADNQQQRPGSEDPLSSPHQPPPTHSPSGEQQDIFPEAEVRLGDTRPPLPPPFCMPSSPELNPKDGDPTAKSTTKKKRVRFGAPLSPEFFDKNLPPSTPLQKGATPARAPPPSSAKGSQVRSVLKSPWRSQPVSSLPEPDFSSPSQACGASPSLRRGPRDSTHPCVATDEGERSPVDKTDLTWETQPLDLNAAFQEDSFTEVFPGVPPSELDSNPAPAPVLGTEPEDVNVLAPASAPVLGPEPENMATPASAPVLGPEPENMATPASAPVLGPEPENMATPASAPVLGPEPENMATPASAPVLGPEPENMATPAPVLGPEPEDMAAPALAPVLGSELKDVSAPASSRSRKRKHSGEVQPVKKRSSRSAAQSAGVKMKKASAKRGWGGKEVDRSLYGSRAYASRLPALSPITETLPPASRSPLPPASRSPLPPASYSPTPLPLHTSTAKTEESLPSLGDAIMAAKLWRERFCTTSTNESAAAGAADPCEAESETPAPSGAFSNRRTASSGKRRRESGPRPEPPQRGRKVSVPADHWLSEAPEGQSESPPSEQPCGDQTSALEDAGSSPPSHTPARASPPPCPPSGIPNQDAAPEQEPASLVKESPGQRGSRAARGRSRGRKSSLLPPSTSTEEQTAEPQPEEGVEGAGWHHGASQAEDAPHISEGHASDPFLPAWHQLDFSIEDVLKPLASRGQRSVRRSLRNHSGLEAGAGAGLAWVPHTSPDSLRAVRRKTRGRRGSASLLQPPLPQDLDL